jgi:hypothetical protein
MWSFLLVFPAASRPSMSKRISFDPKILSIILDILLPIFATVVIKKVCGRESFKSALRSFLRDAGD